MTDLPTGQASRADLGGTLRLVFPQWQGAGTASVRELASDRRCLARGVGMPAEQPHLRCPLPTPDHPRAQPAQANPGQPKPRPWSQPRCCASSTP